MVERLRALFLNHSIISPLCLVVPASRWPHVRQAKFCLRVYQVVFLGALPFSPQLLIDPYHMSLNNLERDVKKNIMDGLYHEQFTSNQVVMQSEFFVSFVWRHKVPIYFSRPQFVGTHIPT